MTPNKKNKPKKNTMITTTENPPVIEENISLNNAPEVVARPTRRSITMAATQFSGEVRKGNELEDSGLNYIAEKIPNFFFYNGEYKQGRDFQIVRSDTQKSIGCVGKNYEIMQNADVFGPVIEIAHKVGAEYDGGGLVFGGESAWMSFRLPFKIAVPSRKNDIFETNIICFNNFAGKNNAFISTFTTRWFCMNQMRAIKAHQKGLEKGANELIHKIRHNSKAKERLALAHSAFDSAITIAKDVADFLAFLDAKPMNNGEMTNFVAQLLPAKEDSEEVSTRLENQRDEIVSLFRNGAGNRGASAFDALNAVTEWTNHFRSGKTTKNKSEQENRLVSTLVPGGQNDTLAIRAAEILAA